MLADFCLQISYGDTYCTYGTQYIPLQYGIHLGSTHLQFVEQWG